jgi:hypothetical protein
MNVTEYLTAMRDTLDDPAKNKWTDEMLIRVGSDRVKSMFREQAKVNNSWHNCEVNIAKEDFLRVEQTLWEVPLRSWCDKILIAWKRERGASTTDHESPQMVRDLNGGLAIERHSARINPSDIYRSSPGYQLVGKTVFRLVRYLDIIDVCLQVTKVPVKLTRGTIDRESGADYFFYLQSEGATVASNGLHDLEFGAYRNATFQFSSPNDTTGADQLNGSIRTCIHSEVESFSTPAGKNVRVFLDTPLPRALQAGDTYEMVLEVPEACSRYIVLCVARECFLKQKSTSGLQALADEYKEERARWLEHISPRELQEPSFMREAVDSRPNEFQRQDFDSGLSNRGW